MAFHLYVTEFYFWYLNYKKSSKLARHLLRETLSYIWRKMKNLQKTLIYVYIFLNIKSDIVEFYDTFYQNHFRVCLQNPNSIKSIFSVEKYSIFSRSRAVKWQFFTTKLNSNWILALRQFISRQILYCDSIHSTRITRLMENVLSTVSYLRNCVGLKFIGDTTLSKLHGLDYQQLILWTFETKLALS